METTEAPPELLEALATRRCVSILTGAGMSAESGVATFRDSQTGLWARFRPEDLATPEAFERDPDTVWQWYQWRRREILKARPHAGHEALALIATVLPGFQLVTQNVDGLHQRGGSHEVIEFHGNIHRNRCSECARPAEAVDTGLDHPPLCGVCNGLLRPDVVWFGEAIPADAIEAATRACECELFLVIGTSAQVYPAAGLAGLARQHGALIVEINPEATPLSSSADACWRTTAAAGLPWLARHLSAA